eukprot:5599834-Amphidinium_carterae.1
MPENQNAPQKNRYTSKAENSAQCTCGKEWKKPCNRRCTFNVKGSGSKTVLTFCTSKEAEDNPPAIA